VKDHTSDGVPFRQVPRRKLSDLLGRSLKLCQASDAAPPDWVYWVRLRIEIEFTIRALLGEEH
jgi:hypothetical protein